MACPNPLTPEDCHALNVVLQSCADTAELIAKCKKIGLPVEEQEAKNNEQKALVESMKAEFFPHNP